MSPLPTPDHRARVPSQKAAEAVGRFARRRGVAVSSSPGLSAERTLTFVIGRLASGSIDDIRQFVESREIGGEWHY